jgi:hypothetical protein
MAASPPAQPLFPTRGLSWAGLVAGPLAWFLDQQLSYSLTPWSCRTGHSSLTYAVSAVALLLALAGAVLSRQAWQRQASAGDTGKNSPARARFFGLCGLLLCLLFGLTVLLDLAAKLAFDACQR